jgi:hypothetical protein
VAGPVGLEHDLRHFAVVGAGGGDAFGALGAAAMQQHHVGMLRVCLVERSPDAIDGLALGPAGEPKESDLIARRIASLPETTVASAEYVDHFGMPKRWDALDGHRMIGVRSSATGIAR